LNIPTKKLVFLAVIALNLLLSGGRLAAEEYKADAMIRTSETYNDNIYLTGRDRRFDYITEIVPAIGVTYKAPFWDWQGSYAYDYFYYSRADFHHDEISTANVTNLTRLYQDTLFVELNETHGRVSLDLQRDYTKQSTFVNQTDQNIFSVKPYTVFHPSARTTMRVGYIYENIWYKSKDAIGQRDNTAFGELGYQVSSQLTFTGTAQYTEDKNRILSYNRGELIGGMRYEYLDGSILTGGIGNVWTYTSDGLSSTQLFWKAGFYHSFPKFKFSFETSLSYPNDPTNSMLREDHYAVSIKREIERTSISATGSFDEFRDGQTKHLQSSSYTALGQVTHKISAQSTFLGDFTYQRLEDNVFNTYTELYIWNLKYEYLAGKNVTMAVAYRYLNSYSPDLYQNNYYYNIYSVEIRKVF